MRVVTWNIDRGEDLAGVAATLTRERPDVTLLQEVDRNTVRAGQLDVAAELSRRLQLGWSYAVEFEELGQERPGDKAYTGQATLSRLPLRGSRTLTFQHQSGFWQPHGWLPSSVPLLQRRLGNRVALITEYTWAGRMLAVYNLHLESRSYGRIQFQQLDEVLGDLDRHYPAGTAVIVGGDLNSKYLPGRYLKYLQERGFQSALGERVERTHKIAMSLDWLFVRGPVACSEGRVVRETRGSDHYAITAVCSER